VHGLALESANAEPLPWQPVPLLRTLLPNDGLGSPNMYIKHRSEEEARVS